MSSVGRRKIYDNRKDVDYSISEANFEASRPSNTHPFFTVGVLVGGVVGGLIIVISVILFCKYCIKRKKSLGGRSVLFKRRSFFSGSYDESGDGHDLEAGMAIAVNNHKRFFQKKALSRCQLASTDTQVTELQTSVDKVEEDNEIDYAVAIYKESLCRDDSTMEEPTGHVSLDSEWDVSGGGAAAASSGVTSSESPTANRKRSVDSTKLSDDGRRVSFLVAADRGVAPVHHGSSVGGGKAFSSSRSPRLLRHESEHVQVRPKEQLKLVKQRSQGCAGHLDHRVNTVLVDDPPLHVSEDGITELTPMLSPVSEEVPLSCKPRIHRSEVTAEVHQDSRHYRPEPHHHHHHHHNYQKKHSPHSAGVPRPCPPKLSMLGKTRRRLEADTRQTASLELVSPRDRWTPLESRKVRSYEGDAYGPRDYDNSDKFNRGPFYNTDYDLMSEGGMPELQSKVRYNDTGSFEEVTEETQMPAELVGRVHNRSPLSPSPPLPPHQVLIMQAADTGSDTDTLNGNYKYRDLWTLRATLEEEEDFSDTIRMEDMTSPEEQSNEEHAATSATTSFESTELSIDASSDETVIRRIPGNLLHPNYESRGHKYRSILSRRFRHIDGPSVGLSTSQDNSFDSVETMETDGDISDTSRPEVTTTSFESTTDNTDSTGEYTTHKLQQMQRDSGYKSLETQQSQTNTINKPPKKQIHFVLDHHSVERDDDERISTGTTSPDTREDQFHRRPCSKGSKPYFDRRNAKTASKKRREYRGERQVLPSPDYASQSFQDSSIHEHETDSRSDQPSGDSFDDGITPKKFSLLNRFTRSQSKESKRFPALSRDFSMDEKTNVLFNEFVRYDPNLEPFTTGTRRSPRMGHSRPRLQRKHTDGSLETHERGRFERLTPGKRSISLGSDSSGGSLRRLSPQDSIEEEYIPEAAQAKKMPSPLCHPQGRRARGVSHDAFSQQLLKDPLPQSRSHHIPIIRLPDEELSSK
ncbi:hypothetical protein CAPTEDRAFT_210377 [Capitella teleta]|uniref:Uncharacterized protein n=1 Tax=Capitella teleta TaxID=283909 RepID=N1PBE2_CAPTE|nr:hypothetical protein CAPTEDRAFT_210377 [Capitella teleta]|eukprot:ELU18899.1 hypothetical protein CAPTEDRAFT_210377 [Capitella teleta]